MLARIRSAILQGIDALTCEIEVDLNPTGLDQQTIVGLPDAAVKEALDRVRAAVTNVGYDFPAGKLLVNLAPADLRKEGPVYDLPIALGLLIANSVIKPNHPDPAVPDFRSMLFAGELALDGRVRPIKGAIAIATLARDLGCRAVMVPEDNAAEAAVVEEIDVFPVSTLAQAVGLLTGHLEAEPHPRIDVAALIEGTHAEIDFAEVKGQEAAKRALLIAAAGSHNILMLGPPGTGKSMMAKALPGILPNMTANEALEVTRVYSAAGKSPRANGSPAGLVTKRAVRSPHHTASASAVIGGGVIPKPGEITLAHHGVLFLDELPEFPRAVLDTLRQPLEDGCVTIARAHSAVRFPASFMLVAAMNPTPKGSMPGTAAEMREMQKYLSRLSGPLVDRIDIHVEVPAVPWKDLSTSPRGTSTAELRDHVAVSRSIQIARQGEKPNAHLSNTELDTIAPLDPGAMELLRQAMTELKLSARAYDKIRRVSRTIADLQGETTLTAAHIAEAIQYRLLDRSV